MNIQGANWGETGLGGFRFSYIKRGFVFGHGMILMGLGQTAHSTAAGIARHSVASELNYPRLCSVVSTGFFFSFGNWCSKRSEFRLSPCPSR